MFVLTKDIQSSTAGPLCVISKREIYNLENRNEVCHSIVWLHLGDIFNSENIPLSIGEHNTCGFVAAKQIFNNKTHFTDFYMFIISIKLLLHFYSTVHLYAFCKEMHRLRNRKRQR